MKLLSIKILLTLFTLASIYSPVMSQKSVYKWSDELELLKRVDRLPEYRTKSYVEQFSSYDRTNGNDDGFSGKYSYLRKENGNLVVAEMNGPGVINRIWTPTPTNDIIAFYIDGEKKPRLELKFSDLFSGDVFPFTKPLCGNEIGGYYCYVPITYSKSIKVVLKSDKQEFIQIQYRDLPGMKVESFTSNYTQSDRDLLKDVNGIWADISPEISSYTAGKSASTEITEKTFTLNPGDEIPFFETNTAGRIVGFEIDGGTSFEGYYKDVILSAAWDNENIEAIYAPVADFFGYAYGKGAMRSIVMGKQGTSNYSYLPMPFDKSAVMKIIYKKRNDVKQSPITVTSKVYYNNEKRDTEKEGKFYSVWRREKPELGDYYTFYEAEGKGHYVGTIHQAQGLRPGMTLFFEGDDSTYVDGKMRLHGTGSEDYYNGGWYALLDRWDRGVSLPVHGSLDYSLPMNRTGGYRFFLSDKMPFEKSIYHGMEHGGVNNDFPVDYISVAFLYSDKPLKDRMEPTDDLRVVYLPTEHVYFPQLMDMALGGGIQVVHDRGIRVNTNNQGMMRVMLNDVPEGKYKVIINYHEKPNGADFQIWQRQKRLSDWKSTKGDKEQFREGLHVGDIELTQQTNSITFNVRKNGDKGDQFELNLITLQRID